MTQYRSSKQRQTKSPVPAKNGVQRRPPQTHPAAILQRAIADPTSVSHDDLLRAQSAYGNRVMRQVLTGGRTTQSSIMPKQKGMGQNVVQRDMQGSLAYVKERGGDASKKSKSTMFGKKKGTYAKLLDELGTYEKAEAKGTQNLGDLDSIYEKASSWLDNDTHTAKMRQEDEKTLGRARAMGHLMGQVARTKGVFGTEERELNQRPTIHLYMGQGIVGFLGEVVLQSDEFSSCSPIVFFNKHTGIGGLYHFPASATKNLGSQSSSHLGYMLAMAEAVQATDIYVHSGGSSVSDKDSSWRTGLDMSTELQYARRDLAGEFREHYTSATVHEGHGSGSKQITLEKGTEVGISMDSNVTTEYYKVKQTDGADGKGHYDLAKVSPPANVLRFGFADAGQQWVNGT